MKKLISILMVSTMFLSLSGCGAKYPDIEEKLTSGDYEGAIQLIIDMMPEPETEEIELTLDNWNEYYTIEEEKQFEKKADGSIKDMSISYCLKLKPEYEEKYYHSENPINIGIEIEWNTYSVSSVDKNTGEYTLSDPVYVDVGYYSASGLKDEMTNYSYLDTSVMEELYDSCYLESINFCNVSNSGNVSYMPLHVEDFENYYVFAQVPTFKIVNVSGTLSLYK